VWIGHQIISGFESYQVGLGIGLSSVKSFHVSGHIRSDQISNHPVSNYFVFRIVSDPDRFIGSDRIGFDRILPLLQFTKSTTICGRRNFQPNFEMDLSLVEQLCINVTNWSS
jgi:hypothetical protein